VPSVSRSAIRGLATGKLMSPHKAAEWYNDAIPVINAAGILSLKATMPTLDELIGKFLPDARTSRVGAARPIIRRHSSTMMTMASRRVYTADPETGYRKGAVSGNKRMTDISGDPDREFAVALSASRHVFRLDFYRDFRPERAHGAACESKVAITALSPLKSPSIALKTKRSTETSKLPDAAKDQSRIEIMSISIQLRVSETRFE